MKCKNNCLGETIIILLIAAIFSGGYVLGKNESCSVPRYDLPESLWEPVHSYWRCMHDRTCVMYVKRVEK